MNRLQVMLMRELTRMVHRRLRFSPAAEDLAPIVATMERDLRQLGYNDADCDRLTEALNAYGCHADVWPTLKQVLDCLPRDPKVAQLEHDNRAQRRQSYANGVRSLREVLEKAAPGQPKGQKQ